MSKPSLVGQLYEWEHICDVFTFFMHVHVTNSKSVICPCTLMCHHLQHDQNIFMFRPLLLRSLASFIISVCEMSSQNILKLITLCGKRVVSENPDACVCISMWSPVRVHGKRKWPASSDRHIRSTVGFQCCIPVISLLLTINLWQTSRLN